MQQLTFATTVIYVAEGVREVLEFYKLALGFEIRYYDDGLKFGELATGGTTIMVGSFEAGEFMVGERFRRPTPGASNVELAFVCADVPSAFERAVANGATPLAAPKTMPWGQTVAYVAGIEGTLIGLLTPPPVTQPG